MKSRILLIDVDVRNLNYLENLLKSEGYDVSCALSSMTAMECIHRDTYDLILLEVLIPALSSFEAYEIIRKELRGKNTPIMFFNDKSESEKLDSEHENVGQNCILKPITSRDLIMRVNTQISRKRCKDEQVALILELDNYIAMFEKKEQYSKVRVKAKVKKPHYDFIYNFYSAILNSFASYGRSFSI